MLHRLGVAQGDVSHAKVDLAAVEQTNRTGYPPPHDAAVAGRFYRRIGEFGGFADFGASHVVLKLGAMSSQRHWH